MEGYAGEHLRERRLHGEKHFLRSLINYHKALVRCLIVPGLTNNSTIGAVTLHSWDLSVAKVNPHTASQPESEK